jgi:hypothetical protein
MPIYMRGTFRPAHTFDTPKVVRRIGQLAIDVALFFDPFFRSGAVESSSNKRLGGRPRPFEERLDASILGPVSGTWTFLSLRRLFCGDLFDLIALTTEYFRDFEIGSSANRFGAQEGLLPNNSLSS